MTQSTRTTNSTPEVAPRSAGIDWSELVAALPVVILFNAVRSALRGRGRVGASVPAVASR